MYVLEQTAIDAAREAIYRFLAIALTDPGRHAQRLPTGCQQRELLAEAAAIVREDAGTHQAELGFGESSEEHLRFDEAFAQLDGLGDRLPEEYDRIFGLIQCRECPPFETEYHTGNETFFQSQQIADVGGFYRAFGIEPGLAGHERPDHVALELEFMAFLLCKARLAAADDARAVCEAAQAAFFREHLAWWLPAFCVGLRRKAEHGFFAEVGELLAAFLRAERLRSGLPAPRVPLQMASVDQPEMEESSCNSCGASA